MENMVDHTEQERILRYVRAVQELADATLALEGIPVRYNVIKKIDSASEDLAYVIRGLNEQLKEAEE